MPSERPSPEATQPDGAGTSAADVARDLKNLRSAADRVRAEAAIYRQERDRFRSRAEELSAKVEALNAQLVKERAQRQADAERGRAALRRARRQLRRTRGRLQALEASRAVRLARRARTVTRRLTAPFSTRPTIAAKPAQKPPAIAPRPDARTSPATAAAAQAPTLITRFGDQAGMDLASNSAAANSAERAAAYLTQRLAGGRTRLRVAAIVDDFTRQSLSLDCDFHDLHPDRWADEITTCDPDILFVESAWRGESGSWHNTVPALTEDLRAIIAHCREVGIPTVFWNKEDPVHFQTFLRTAREFDHVLTTDIDCVPRYRAALGHDRVGFLPFACQPKLQNPVETFERKDALGFAGGYYTRYTERMRDLDALLEGASRVMPVEIWDRMYGTTLEDYRFPDRYQPMIRGTLDPTEIDVAYKGYRFALNLNSVKHSQSMFARRAYELLSSGTVTISNYARGLRVMLGDLVPMSDDPGAVEATLTALREDEVTYDRLRLMGLRKVHTEHTYRARLDSIVAQITGVAHSTPAPRVAVLIGVENAAEADRALESVTSQRGVGVEVTAVCDDELARTRLADAGWQVYRRAELPDTDAVLGGAAALAVLDPRDWYGPQYLLDLVLALEYCGTDVVGKAGAAAAQAGGIARGHRDAAYRRCEGLEPRRALVRAAAASALGIEDLLHAESGTLAGLSQFSIDRFDYCRDGADADLADLQVLRGDEDIDTGWNLADLQALLISSSSDSVADPTLPVVDHRAIAAVRGPQLTVRDTGQGVRIQSALPAGKIDLRWLSPRVDVDDVWPDGVARARLDYDGDLHLMFAIRYFDAAGDVLKSFTEPADKMVEHPVPDGAVEAAIALRLAGPGTSTVRMLALAHPQVQPLIVPSGRDTLVVTDHYPSYTDLYRNGFLHTRVAAYASRGLEVDVFRTRDGEPLRYHEFSGVEVTSGAYEQLQRTLAAGSYSTILVHFLSERLWAALEPFRDSHRIICWVHGAEVKPWWRRNPEHLDDAALSKEKADSERRATFWQGLLDDLPERTSFVLVSRHFADEVQSDLGRTIPPDQLHVIHNPIDTSLFAAHEKPASQRTKVLSIRSFASAKYANDLTVAAILELSSEPWFDELEFRLIGDGPLFTATVEPVRDFPNVMIERGFLTQPQMAELHREYGVFLVPSRSDTQGVSRDEAMASGLVPITSDVEAIPEFVSTREGYLAPPDDHREIARAIAELRSEPDLFLEKSRLAAARARAQVSADVVVPAEIALIRSQA